MNRPAIQPSYITSHCSQGDDDDQQTRGAMHGVLLLIVLAFTTLDARRFGFNREDEIAAVLCGSKKSLASGLPLAQVLFAGAPGFGMIVLPIMLCNQIQILIGAVLARRYAECGRAARTVNQGTNER